jgi:hypothetical protein
MALKLLRTIRLDASDTFVFERAAAPGEWATPGAFRFWDDEPATLAGKRLSAFRAGFLGVDSFGWSTLAIVEEATEADRDAAVAALASGLVAHMGAPDLETARAAAEEEIAFAAGLCDHPPKTLVALRRSFEDGAIREQFRTLTPGRPAETVKAFSFVEVTGEDEGPRDEIDLAALAERRP